MQELGVYAMGLESVDLGNLSEMGVVSQVLLWQQNAVQPMCDRWLHERGDRRLVHKETKTRAGGRRGNRRPALPTRLCNEAASHALL